MFFSPLVFMGIFDNLSYDVQVCGGFMLLFILILLFKKMASKLNAGVKD